MSDKLSPKRAWLFMAALWDEPETDSDARYGAWVVVDDPRVAYGLCGTIAQMWAIELIDGACQEVLMDRIREAKGKDGYYWECNAEGAKLRAAFCREQAAKIP